MVKYHQILRCQNLPHHLPPLPHAHNLSLSLPCPAHLLPSLCDKQKSVPVQLVGKKIRMEAGNNQAWRLEMFLSSVVLGLDLRELRLEGSW